MTVVKLGDIIKLSKGKKADDVTSNKIVGQKRYIQIDDLRNDDNLKYTSSKGVEVSPDDVVIAWDGANAGTIGFGLTGIIGSTLAKIAITDPEIDPQYLGLFLRSKVNYLRSKTTGATIPHINKATLMTIEIPIIALNEQKRIVKILREAESLRQKRNESLKLLDSYLRTTFLTMFSEDKHLAKVTLESLSQNKKGSMRTGPFGSDLKHSEFIDSGVAVLGIDNAVKNQFTWDKRRFISFEKYEKLKRYTIFPRDVIVTIMGTTGRSAVIPDDIPLAINTKHLAAITFDETKANPYFMCYSLQADPRITRQIQQRSKGAIMDGLNLTIIKNLEFSAWPIERQNKFEVIYHKVQSLRQDMTEQAEVMNAQFEALAQKAFKIST